MSRLRTFGLITFGALLFACSHKGAFQRMESANTMRLKWNQSFESQTIEQAKIGLEWMYSYFGASLPKEVKSIEIQGNILVVHTDRLGLSQEGMEALHAIHRTLESSQEYKKNKTIDLGRYVAILLGAPQHYYALSEVPVSLDSLLVGYRFLPDIGHINNSFVSLGNRRLRFSEIDGHRQLLMAEEVDSLSGATVEYEVIERMKNGQLRFAIYGSDRLRRSAADCAYSNGGKPAKCMWCHESSIQPIFSLQKNIPEFLTYDALFTRINSFRDDHDTYKTQISSSIDYSQPELHIITELLYTCYYEPTAVQLSNEWNLPIATVRALLKDYESHDSEEYPFLKGLYHRDEIEHLAPFRSAPTPGDAREESEQEINFLK